MGRAVLFTAMLATASVALSGCAGLGATTPEFQVRTIDFWVEEIDWEIHPDVWTKVWAFCAEGDGVEAVHDGACGVPGPTIRVTEGDHIVLRFRNDHAIPHTVHFHGWHPYAMDMNGNGALGEAMVVPSGGITTIRWTAEPAGTFIYHCHFDTPTHMEMGMSGVFIVEEADAERADVDNVVVLDEWQIRADPEYVGNIPAYNYFTINGKSFPLTAPIVAQQGDHVRLHMVNAGYEFHAMHIHGYTPDSWEGVAGPDYAVPTDVREIAPGQSVVLDFTADREGIWLFHDHVVPRVTAASDGTGFGAYPRGMLTALVVGDEYLDQLIDLVPTLLGAAKDDVTSPQGHDDGAAQSPEPEQASIDEDAIQTDMEGFKFVETDLQVPAGSTVTWMNKDQAIHTVTSADGLFDSGNIQAGQHWSYTFTEPGTYKIYCKPHSYQQDGEWKGMVATVTVA